MSGCKYGRWRRYRAFLLFRDLLADGKTNTSACICFATVQALEHFKDPFIVFRQKSDTVVRHC